MNLPVELFGNVVVVHAPEEVGLEQADGLRTFLTGQERRNVVLDLDDSESLDSAGLTAVLDAQDRLRAQGGDVKLATANAANRKILEITRLDRQLEVFDSVIEAVKSYQ